MAETVQQSRKPISVLLVDDQPLIRRLLVDILQRDASFVVVGEASDGADALDRARELKPELVLMDIEMPGINGVFAASLIRDFSPQVRVILTSAFDDPEYQRAAGAVGALGFIPKAELCTEGLRCLLETSAIDAPTRSAAGPAAISLKGSQ